MLNVDEGVARGGASAAIDARGVIPVHRARRCHANGRVQRAERAQVPAPDRTQQHREDEGQARHREEDGVAEALDDLDVGNPHVRQLPEPDRLGKGHRGNEAEERDTDHVAQTEPQAVEPPRQPDVPAESLAAE